MSFSETHQRSSVTTQRPDAASSRIATGNARAPRCTIANGVDQDEPGDLTCKDRSQEAWRRATLPVTTEQVFAR
jgi:hypothetical protein